MLSASFWFTAPTRHTANVYWFEVGYRFGKNAGQQSSGARTKPWDRGTSIISEFPAKPKRMWRHQYCPENGEGGYVCAAAGKWPHRSWKSYYATLRCGLNVMQDCEANAQNSENMPSLPQKNELILYLKYWDPTTVNKISRFILMLN